MAKYSLSLRQDGKKLRSPIELLWVHILLPGVSAYQYPTGSIFITRLVLLPTGTRLPNLKRPLPSIQSNIKSASLQAPATSDYQDVMSPLSLLLPTTSCIQCSPYFPVLANLKTLLQIRTEVSQILCPDQGQMNLTQDCSKMQLIHGAIL